MKPSLALKTVLRSPVRTVLTLVLLGLTSFALFTRVAEYAITRREIYNAASHYRGVGAAEISPPHEFILPYGPLYIEADPRLQQGLTDEELAVRLSDLNSFIINYNGLLDQAAQKPPLDSFGDVRYRPLTREQITAISELPYVSLTDTRYMTAGVSDDYFRLGEGSLYSYTARCIVEATLIEVDIKPPQINISTGFSFNRLELDDCVLLAGNSAFAAKNSQFEIRVNPDASLYQVMGWNSGSIGELYTSNFIYGPEYLETLVPGHRYVFVLQYGWVKEDQQDWGLSPFYLSDHLTNPWCEAVQLIENEPDNYLELEKFAALRKLIELTNADDRTFDVVYTLDMGSILRFSEGDMAITKGRALTREDSENGEMVCVISRSLANIQGLGVGDSITLRLGSELFEQYKSLGAVAVTQERYSPPVKTVTLEIAGIYADTDSTDRQRDNPNWNYSVNTVFVPAFLLPADESQLRDHVFSPAEFSFTVDNPWGFPAFLEAADPLFEELGLRLIFNDKGWPAIVDSFRAGARLSIISITVFSAAIIAAVGFIVYLFIGRKKRDYAIMRALGTPKKASAFALILPLITVALVSILAGSGVAWIYTVKTISRSNTLLALNAFAVNTSIPAGVVPGCVFGELLLTLLFAHIILKRIGAASPLELLQGATRRQLTIDNGQLTIGDADACVENTEATDSAGRGSIIRVPKPLSRTGTSALNIHIYPWYISRHIRRTARKAALSLLLPALLLCAIGQLKSMQESYADVFANTVITARIIGGLPLTAAWRIAGSEYTAEPYYEAVGAADADFMQSGLIFTNDISRYIGEDTIIKYADGYDATCMDNLDYVVFAGKAFLEERGLAPGDSMLITRSWLYRSISASYVDRYRALNPGSVETDEEIAESFRKEIMNDIMMQSWYFTIAGVVTSASGKYDSALFSPGINSSAALALGLPTEVSMAEYTVADNSLIDEFRDFCEAAIGGGAASGVAIVMDTGKIENIRNVLRLLDTLYPIVFSAALLIGAFVCCLVILQSSKEAAIMRVQGTTKAKTRTLLSLEQMLLVTAGLVLGFCIMVLYRGAEPGATSGGNALFALTYFVVTLTAAVACSTLATRRSVLELLQNKE